MGWEHATKEMLIESVEELIKRKDEAEARIAKLEEVRLRAIKYENKNEKLMELLKIVEASNDEAREKLEHLEAEIRHNKAIYENNEKHLEAEIAELEEQRSEQSKARVAALQRVRHLEAENARLKDGLKDAFDRLDRQGASE